ncbi:hypothetical protein PIROE2DRAFT_18256 [Piromyces sp. E2]|nr:hypothetical protein PIROE2DRAFT_18256 [Piromyces sp. E2]|eukprot:OUM56929.1 hypothetical protein PIROE2DRAFT_18256 [Piromyces sp. E2]
MNFNLIKKDNLIGIQYTTKDEEIKMQFVFFNNNDSLSFFTFFSPYMPYKILSDDYKVTTEAISSHNTSSSFTIFHSPIGSTPSSKESQLSTIINTTTNNVSEFEYQTTINKTNLQVQNSWEPQKKNNNNSILSNLNFNMNTNNNNKDKNTNLNNGNIKQQNKSISKSANDTISSLLKQQDINKQIQQYLNLPDYQLLKYIYEILDNSNFVELVEKIDDLYSSYISE